MGCDTCLRLSSGLPTQAASTHKITTKTHTHTELSSGDFYRNRRTKINRPKSLCPWNGSHLLWSSLFCRCTFTQVFCIWLTPLRAPCLPASLHLKLCSPQKKKKAFQLLGFAAWHMSSLPPSCLKCKGLKLKATACKCIQHAGKWRKCCHGFDGIYLLFLCRNGTLRGEIGVGGGRGF